MTITSAKDFAHKLNDKLRLNLTPRPWNLYDADDSFYWLVPSGEWPAYRYPKFVFSSIADYPRKLLTQVDELIYPNKMFVGLNIEKGFGEDALFVDSGLRRKKQVNDDTWAWSTFVKPEATARFARTLQRLSEVEETHVYAVSSYVHDRESNQRPPYDVIVFLCAGERITPVTNNRFPVGVLAGLEQTNSFEDLMNALRTVDDYHWVDIYAGTYVETGDVDLLKLYTTALSYFEPWLR